MLAAGPDVGEHHEAEAALAVAGEGQAVDGVGCRAELADRGCVRGDLSKRRGRTGDVRLLEQGLVVPEDRQVGEIRHPVVLVADCGQGEVARAEL